MSVRLTARSAATSETVITPRLFLLRRRSRVGSVTRNEARYCLVSSPSPICWLTWSGHWELEAALTPLHSRPFPPRSKLTSLTDMNDEVPMDHEFPIPDPSAGRDQSDQYLGTNCARS